MKRILWPIILVFGGSSALATITSQTAQTTYTIIAVPQAVPVGFPFQQGSDLLVTDAGSGGAPRSPAATLVLGSDYTVTGGGYNSANAMQTGSLQVVGTGANSVLANDVLTITRNVPINQISSFVSSGALTVQNIEQGLDKQATISQELYNASGRSLQFPIGDTTSGTLPNVNTRASGILGFSPTGQVQIYSPASVTYSSQVPIQVTSISALESISVAGLVTGYQIPVAGYYSPGDGGGAPLVIARPAGRPWTAALCSPRRPAGPRDGFASTRAL